MIQHVHVPTSIEAALSHVLDGAQVLGGGTVLMARINTVGIEATELVSLRVAGVDGVERAGDRVRIGAATPLSRLEQPGAPTAFLRPALATIASPSVRNTATVGGNLFVRQPYGDLAAALIALRADAEIATSAGVVARPVEEVCATGVQPGEIVTHVGFDLPDPSGWRYTKAMRRRFNSGAIATVAAVLELDGRDSEGGGTVTAASIGLGGLSPRPLRSTAAEEALVGAPLDTESVGRAAEAAQRQIDPSDDAYASAWYRRRVFPVHFRRALLGA